jgi:hypothetical protein
VIELHCVETAIIYYIHVPPVQIYEKNNFGYYMYTHFAIYLIVYIKTHFIHTLSVNNISFKLTVQMVQLSLRICFHISANQKLLCLIIATMKKQFWNKGNTKRGISPRLKIRPCDLDLWPWKSIGLQILLRSKFVPSLVKIHWRMLILDCSQGCYAVKIWPLDLWPWKSIGFHTLLRTKYVPSLVKIHWRVLILECSQGCYVVKIWPGDLDRWPWKSIGFQILLRTKYVPSLVKIHWRMLILKCSQGCYGRTDSSVTISLSNFVGEGIKKWANYFEENE